MCALSLRRVKSQGATQARPPELASLSRKRGSGLLLLLPHILVLVLLLCRLFVVLLEAFLEQLPPLLAQKSAQLS